MKFTARTILQLSSTSLFLLLLSATIVLAEAPSKTVVVLFDISGSTLDPAIREQYRNDFMKITDPKHALMPGDAIAADLIADSSSAGSTLPINEELEDYSWDTNTIKVKKANREMLKKIMENADVILKSNQKTKNTDILSSLQIAERVFKTYNKERNVLVIMSDMVEDSQNYNFEKEKLTDKRITEIIAKERKAGRLPDLKNVQVYAIKNATAQSKLDHGAIQNFWLRYFQETGARIDKAHYGPLTKFE